MIIYKSPERTKTRLFYLTAIYNPSTATLACQIPNFLTARRSGAAGNINANETGTKTSRKMVRRRVMLGLIIRK